MMKINRKEMIDNLEDAIYQLESIKHALEHFPKMDQKHLRSEIRKAYQFLNLSWNARHLKDEEYWELCLDEPRFQKMGNYPTDIDLIFVPEDAKRSSANTH